MADRRHKPLSRMYYLIAGVGGVLLLVIIVGVALCRRNTVNAKKRLAMLHAPLSNQDQDELHTDVMMRHQLANEQEGKMNPLYGAEEHDVSTRWFCARVQYPPATSSLYVSDSVGRASFLVYAGDTS